MLYNVSSKIFFQQGSMLANPPQGTGHPCPLSAYGSEVGNPSPAKLVSRTGHMRMHFFHHK